MWQKGEILNATGAVDNYYHAQNFSSQARATGLLQLLLPITSTRVHCTVQYK